MLAVGSQRAMRVSVRVSFHLHVIHDVVCFERSLVVPCFSLSCFLSLLPLLFHTPPVLCPGTPSSMSTPPRVKTTAHTQNEEYCTMAIYNPLIGNEPKLLDDFDHSETSAMIFQDESGDIDTEPSYSCNSTMRLSEKRYLHHCSFRSEKNQRTGDKLVTLMKKVCCQLSPVSHTQVRRDPNTNSVRAKNESQVAKWNMKESGFSLKD